MKRQLIKLIEYLLKKTAVGDWRFWISVFTLADMAFWKSTKVPGHIVEIGVVGRNSLIFSKLISVTGENSLKKYYGFDTIEGYPLDTVNSNPGLSSKSWKSNSCTLSAVTKRLEDCGLSQFCTFIKGDCRITLKQFLNSYDDIKVNKGRMVIALLYWLQFVRGISCLYWSLGVYANRIFSCCWWRERQWNKALIDFASEITECFTWLWRHTCLYCKAIVASLRKLSLIRGHEFSASITQLSCIAAKKTFRFSIFENKANLT